MSGTRKRTAKLRWIEYLLLVAGLAAVDYTIWINVNSLVYETYDEWKFERTLHGEGTSLSRFIVDDSGLRRIIGLGREPERTSGAMNPPTGYQSQVQSPRRRHRDELIGRIEIPRLDVKAIVREGDDEGTLRHAVGHIPSTAFPGEIGNVALAAHRDTIFRPLRNIRKDDRIIVSTLDGTYEYQVQSTKIVVPTDVSVLKASAGKELTLVTCYPFYYIGSAPRRFVVHAVQVGATQQPQPPPLGS